MNEQKLREQLREHEGFVPHAYQDSLTYWTIGIGRLIDKRKGGRITLDEAYFLLQNDINETKVELEKRLPWWDDMDDVRQRVIVDMAFNLGVPNLLGFKNTLRAMKAGFYEEVAQGMLASLWARQVGRRARRLAEMMRTGRDVPMSQVRSLREMRKRHETASIR